MGLASSIFFHVDDSSREEALQWLMNEHELSREEADTVVLKVSIDRQSDLLRLHGAFAYSLLCASL